MVFQYVMNLAQRFCSTAKYDSTVLPTVQSILYFTVVTVYTKATVCMTQQLLKSSIYMTYRCYFSSMVLKCGFFCNTVWYKLSWTSLYARAIRAMFASAGLSLCANPVEYFGQLFGCNRGVLVNHNAEIFQE